MPKWLKIVIGLVVSFIIVFAVAGIVFYNMVKSSIPEYSGEVSVGGLSENVEIYSDSMAIPYILANNDNDAAFTLGYLHARDRLFQMDFIRRAAEGRLSEVFGTRTIPYDKMFLTMGIKRTAYANLKLVPQDNLRLLQSYSNGVNAFIKENKNKLTIEFDFLNYDPEEWKPVHSMEVIRMMAWELNIGWWTDFTFYKLIKKFGKQKAGSLIPDFGEGPKGEIQMDTLPEVSDNFLKTSKEFRNFMGSSGTHIGSNNWVVNGTKSTSGMPIIANDPHLSYSMPGKWYAAVVKSGGNTVSGFTLPGVPAFAIGKNDNIAWTLTNVMNDDCDFYIEELDQTKKNYIVDGEPKPITTIKEIIKVKDSLDVEHTIRITHRGPIINDTHLFTLLYQKDKQPNAVMSMRWMGNEPSDEFSAFVKINKAKNWNEFTSGVNMFSVPAQNFVYADKNGNIGYKMGGRIPLRTNNKPQLVYDGKLGSSDWTGIAPPSDFPEIFNPTENYIATANNKVLEGVQTYLTNLWEPSSRIDRINQLLTSKDKHSVQDYKNYQLDQISPYAKEITKEILKAFEGLKIKDKNLKETLLLFEKWNYDFDENSQTPAIYSVFLNTLLKNIFIDEMGDDLFNEYVFVANVPYRILQELLLNENSIWYDDTKTPKREDKKEIIRKSLADALTDLENQFGKDLAEWQWGRLHKVKMKHPFSGQSSLIDEKINIGPQSIGGDGTTIFNTEYPFFAGSPDYAELNHEPYENTLGPSMRFIYDFSNPNVFYMITTTGESGNIMSDHYKDMYGLWISGKYLTIKTDEASIRNSNNKLFTLKKKD
ncbi:MAG TPA: penicillin acylase family protein [Ignavibacteriaceae bacterium]|nr:penicillin acylase family protein [Ignavibacteriaceae bacterium]